MIRRGASQERASPVTQHSRICLLCRRRSFHPWVGKIPWRRAWLPTLVPREVSFRESPRSVSCCVTRVGISPILRCRFRSWGRFCLSPTLSACVSPVPLFYPRRSALPFLGGRAGAKRPKAPFSRAAFYPLTILLSSVYIQITY